MAKSCGTYKGGYRYTKKKSRSNTKSKNSKGYGLRSFKKKRKRRKSLFKKKRRKRGYRRKSTKKRRKR